ncbi:MAG: hypothetical protein LC679_08660, partial [Intrasporangiaceae bacterium]|nr:hypothetical protein [Intrasporangiaceae bacterium]
MIVKIAAGRTAPTEERQRLDRGFGKRDPRARECSVEEDEETEQRELTTDAVFLRRRGEKHTGWSTADVKAAVGKGFCRT